MLKKFEKLGFLKIPWKNNKGFPFKVFYRINCLGSTNANSAQDKMVVLNIQMIVNVQLKHINRMNNPLKLLKQKRKYFCWQYQHLIVNTIWDIQPYRIRFSIFDWNTFFCKVGLFFIAWVLIFYVEKLVQCLYILFILKSKINVLMLRGLVLFVFLGWHNLSE